MGRHHHDHADDTPTERTSDLRQLADHYSHQQVYRACHVTVIGHE